jgi:hypothetical protein
MDESSIYLDSPSSYTFDVNGTRRVKANTTGNEKTRLSAAFSAAADGTKLPVFAIVPRLRPIPDIDALTDIESEYKTSSTFNDDMIIIYLSRIIISYMQRKGLSTVLLIIDSAPCHLTTKVREFCSQNLIKLAIIPPRMTNLIQPADVCWFAPFKKELKKKWNHWYVYEQHTFTINENMRFNLYSAF